MSVVDSRYDKLYPRARIVQDEIVLAQAWKKTHTFVRRYNWYADVLELDVSGVCLPENLAAWSADIANGDYATAPAWLVPAPKNGLWCFSPESEGGWQPRRVEGEQTPVLRPLAHIGVREQSIATAVMLCLADCVESAQGDTSLPAERAAEMGVFSYGNRLFCNWSKGSTVASFAWGNSNTYSRYFQDYQKYIERPLVIAKNIEVGEDAKIFIVSMDVSAFFDNIDIALLVDKLKAAYQVFFDSSKDDLQPADNAFWDIALRALSFKWREGDLALSPLFRDGVLPLGLPQGLVASGFFANAYLLDFDRGIGSFIDRKPRGRSFRIHDYCRYVDDLKLVISVEADEETPHDLANLSGEITDWVQGLLKKHTTTFGPDGTYLRLNAQKTQLEALVEIGTESGTGARMKTLQQQLSGPFDLDSLRHAEAGLNGLLSLAELGLVEGTRPARGILSLATVAALKHEVRDDSLTRFSAYRLVRSLRQRRRITDLTEANDGEKAVDALRHDYQAAARRLVSAWALNPSLVQVLRYALDLWPSVELLEPIEQALLSKLDDTRPNSEFGRRVAFYVLADLFKAGATETGREAIQDSNFKVSDVGAYRVALAGLASRMLDERDAPWYVQQQASLLLASVGQAAIVPQNAPELRFHRALHLFARAKSPAVDLSFEEEVVVSLVGHQLLMDDAHYTRWFISFGDARNRKQVSKAWKIVAESSPVLFRHLLNSKRNGMQPLIAWAPRHLTRFAERRWSAGSAPLPTKKWLPLLTVITHPRQFFSQENALLKLAEALGKSKTVRTFDPELLTPLNVEVRSDDWEELKNPGFATLEAQAVISLKKTDGTYDTPPWCRPEDAWMYAFGRLLRAAATGEPDFTARHWLASEDTGWYSGLKSTWHKRRLGMLHSAEGLRGTTAAITPWFSDLLMHLLRWPGVAERKSLGAATITTRRDFNDAVRNRLGFQKKLYGVSSGVPIYRYPIEWPLNQDRGLRVAMVQGLMPLHHHFKDGLAGLDNPGYREKHRNHTAALLHLTSKHLGAREYVLGVSEKPHIDVVVFPELSIHVGDQDLMRSFSDSTGAMLFYGLLGAKDPTSDEPINAARWLVPQRHAGRRSWVEVDQGKFNLTPEEHSLGIKPWRPYQVVIELLDSTTKTGKSYRLTGSVCFDATDLSLASDLRNESHMYVVSAMNKDVKTFDGMVAALRYHMYQHILIANIGEFGGSTAQAPYDKEHQRLISHSHGGNQLAISVIDVRLEDFGPELEAALPAVTKMKEVKERIGKAPPAGLNRA
ncbi:RNA-directed DNA polymerase [Xanthomonas sp. fls2-241-TYG-148]|uniref:RNA-directed DNA polymerase n=1 Tax=Xanthomonas sp. fls2-241-TYG-148 TaxID=3040328 RepID=UPI0025561160|nr:RNA-directed DNA polymerase [Xanthomonas sp. fls2-241-TYG-148]